MQNWKPPRDNDNYRWTAHVGRKMQFYGLSPSRVLRVVRAAERIEEGVAPGTLAGMSPFGRSPVGRQTKKPYRGEIWAMWRQDGKGRRKVIITAWRYPGVSPVRSAVPLPPGVLAELEGEGLLDS